MNVNASLNLFKPIESGNISIASSDFPAQSAHGVGDGTSFDKFLMDTLGSIVTGNRRVARNAPLFRTQERLRSLYVVRFGQFKLIGNDSKGQKCVVGFHMAGDWMGLNGMAAGCHDFSAVALDDSEVLEVRFHGVDNLMNMATSIQSKILQVTSEALGTQYDDLMYRGASLDCRFARFLRKLGEKYARLGYSRNIFRLCMSRNDIGNYLGATCESMSRVVARFNASGIATIKGRNVEVHDWMALVALSNVLQPNAKRAAVH